MHATVFHYEVPRWGIMWCVAVALYGVSKLCIWMCRRQGTSPLWKHAGFLFAWPGMDVDGFLFGRRATVPGFAEWWFAGIKTASGLFCVLILSPFMERLGLYATAWTGMLGIVFTLHFGLFHLLSCGWRSIGVEAVPIMNWPIASVNLPEFWGKRWNLAFRDLTNRLLFRPLIGTCGTAGALLISFIVSGLIHELVISLPAGGGYGLPTLYFTIQGAAILLQRSKFAMALSLSSGLRGWLFTAFALVFPAPLLFHRWFLERVVIPFLQVVSVGP